MRPLNTPPKDRPLPYRAHENQQHKYDIGLFDKNLISGENNHMSKLTTKDVEYIRRNYIKGSRQFGARPMARKFSVSHPTIMSVIKYKTWTSVDNTA